VRGFGVDVAEGDAEGRMEGDDVCEDMEDEVFDCGEVAAGRGREERGGDSIASCYADAVVEAKRAAANVIALQ